MTFVIVLLFSSLPWLGFFFFFFLSRHCFSGKKLFGGELKFKYPLGECLGPKTSQISRDLPPPPSLEYVHRLWQLSIPHSKLWNLKCYRICQVFVCCDSKNIRGQGPLDGILGLLSWDSPNMLLLNSACWCFCWVFAWIHDGFGLPLVCRQHLPRFGTGHWWHQTEWRKCSPLLKTLS